jgi:RNA polymerase sigma-70 factor (ECF subfamily)
MIFRLAYRYSRSPQDAEDIMQDTFIKAFKGIGKFDFSISTNFSAWIYQIGLNCSLDYLRKRKRRKSDLTASLADAYGEPEGQNSSPEKLAITNQAVTRLKNALSSLSPKQRLVFDLRHLQHRAIKEISERLHCSQSTVKEQLHRAVSKLRNQLEPMWREK